MLDETTAPRQLLSRRQNRPVSHRSPLHKTLSHGYDFRVKHCQRHCGYLRRQQWCSRCRCRAGLWQNRFHCPRRDSYSQHWKLRLRVEMPSVRALKLSAQMKEQMKMKIQMQVKLLAAWRREPYHPLASP